MSVRHPLALGGSIFIGAGYLRRWEWFASRSVECVLERQTLAQAPLMVHWLLPTPPWGQQLCFMAIPSHGALLYLGARNDWAKESLFETLEPMGQDMSSSFWMVSQVLCHGDANLAHAQVALWQNGLQTQSACSFIICPRQRFPQYIVALF